jgi:hypothetical protein
MHQTPPSHQMAALPPMAPTYMYPQQPIIYNPYMQPVVQPVVHPYFPPNGTGTSTPRSTTSGGSATPATNQSTKEAPSPR